MINPKGIYEGKYLLLCYLGFYCEGCPEGKGIFFMFADQNSYEGDW